MNMIEYLKSYVNPYSVIGSLIYGIVCVSGTIFGTPEITSKAIYVLGFVSSCIFYFGMYILYKNRKIRTWRELAIITFKICLIYTTIHTCCGIIVMRVYGIPYYDAGMLVTHYTSRFFYYIIFLP